MLIGNIILFSVLVSLAVFAVIGIVVACTGRDYGFSMFLSSLWLMLIAFIVALCIKINCPQYFIASCPACGAVAQDNAFCSSCGAELIPYCDCGRKVQDGETYCPDCGNKHD